MARKKIEIQKNNPLTNILLGFAGGIVVTCLMGALYFKFSPPAHKIPPTNNYSNSSQNFCLKNCPYKSDGATDIDCVVGCIPCADKCVNSYEACRPVPCSAGPIDFAGAFNLAVETCEKRCVISSNL